MQDRLQKWGQRLKVGFLAAIVLNGIHLTIFGFDPKGFIQRHPWSSSLDGVLSVAVLFLSLGVVACWFGMACSSGHATPYERRLIFVGMGLFLLSNLGRLWKGVPGVFVATSVTQFSLCVLGIWYLAKVVGENTQREINAKLSSRIATANEPEVYREV